ncbi:MAG: UDP-N-acetylmuramoyl-L-alanyl-D-glutamate--2,6-diaminopimelate ligase, partial [Chloroflexi bacterium]|nr:UDP-N-acetylmuramoyl-L-alanyl-D-glutamate--2,6-diaminopimelate ligase [Chloroflexota bacterium]
AVARLIAAAEPTRSQALGGLIGRLDRAGLLLGAREGMRAIAPRALAGVAAAGITQDSRSVRPGTLFVAVSGEHADGHDFLPAAHAAGAAGAIVEHAVPDPLPQLVVARTRAALAEAACWWYGDPSHKLGVIGITGTDGKSTTGYLATAALEAAGHSTGLLGTVELKIGTERGANPEHVTTPEAPELQAALRAMVRAGNELAVVETTSHGLALERVRGIAYDVAIFTNLSHEHLELHGTFEAYRAAKLGLFERLGRPADGKPWPRAGIVNRDDAEAAIFEAVTRESGARLVTYGTDRGADVRAERVEESVRGTRFRAATPTWGGEIHLTLMGRFNVLNALAVIALGEALGFDLDAMAAGLADVPGVPGRMERIEAGQPFTVVVDYAHSPAALEHVLELLAPLAAARGGGVVAVFGSAGERDRAKRPIMGRIAGQRCRLVVLTDEDPRGEESTAILEDIARGARDAGRRDDRDLLLVPDRRAAIEAAFERALPGDVVLLAGKGHEQSILYAGGPRPWDEATAARDALAALGFSGPGS